MKERRKSQRMPLAVLLEICAQETHRSVGKGFITNLSDSGLALETMERLSLGDNFLLRFTLLNGWSFDVLGEVVYARDGVLTKAYGIEFAKINTDQRTKLKNYVAAYVQH